MKKDTQPHNEADDTRESEDEIMEKEDWRNEHGQPDFAFLHSLAQDGSIEALEKLNAIAEDLDVGVDQNVSASELVERIRLAAQQNEEGGQSATT